MSFWASRIDQGTARLQVALTRFDAPEAARHQVQRAYDRVLGRAPRPSR